MEKTTPDITVVAKILPDQDNTDDQARADGISKTDELDTHIQSADAKALAGDFEGTLEEYDAIIRIDPGNCQALKNRAALKYELHKDTESTMADLSEAIRINPNDAVAYGSRSVVKLACEDLAGALDDCYTALRLTPDDASFYKTRGTIWAALGQHQAANADFKEADRLEGTGENTDGSIPLSALVTQFDSPADTDKSGTIDENGKEAEEYEQEYYPASTDDDYTPVSYHEDELTPHQQEVVARMVQDEVDQQVDDLIKVGLLIGLGIWIF